MTLKISDTVALGAGHGLIRLMLLFAYAACAASATAANHAAGAAAHARYRIVALSDDRLAFGARINLKGQVAFTDLDGPDPGVYRARFFDGTSLHTLGTFGGNNVVALGLNRHGQVTGYADVPETGQQTGVFHAFRWSKQAGMVDIGRTPLRSSYGAVINDQGEIAGAAGFPPAGDALHAARWNARNRVQDLGTLAGGTSAAAALNQAGTVVGWTEAPQNTGLRLPFRWTPAGGMQALGTLASAGATASDVNLDGAIAGSAPLRPGGTAHAFLWTKQSGPIDLGTGSGDASGATRLNDKGMLIGSISRLPAFGIGFVWTRADGLIELGKLGVNASSAEDLNQEGRVVGAFDGRAYLWTRERGMTDLNTLVSNAPRGLVLLRASAINDAGLIVASTNAGLVLLSPGPASDQRPVVGPILVTGKAQAGATLSFHVSFTDVDVRDTHKAVWDWGDGNTAPATLSERGGSGNVSAQHSYAAEGEYIVRLTVTDASGKSTTVRLDLPVSETGQCRAP